MYPDMHWWKPEPRFSDSSEHWQPLGPTGKFTPETRNPQTNPEPPALQEIPATDGLSAAPGCGSMHWRNSRRSRDPRVPHL